MLGMVTVVFDVPVEIAGMVSPFFDVESLTQDRILHGQERLILKTLKVMIATGG